MTLETIAAAVAAPQPVDSDEIKLCELVKLPPLEYDRKRQEVADAMGCRVSTLDAEVARRREEAAEHDVDASLLPGWAVVPADEPVDGAALLDEVCAEIAQRAILPDHGAEAAALWVLHTWTHDSADCSPLLSLSSPEKRCGKTTVLGAIGRLVARPLPASNISPPMVFRSVEKWRPSLLIDEADTFMGDNDELRGLINSGHTRAAAFVIRGTGEDFEPTVFSTWAPKLIAGIGKMADTLADRSISLPMRRKMPGETVLRQRAGADPAADETKRRLARWSVDNIDALRRADPVLPDGLNDRAADNWRHLFAIADLAGGKWPTLARDAARALSGADAEPDTVRTMLLGDLRDLFATRKVDRLSSSEITAALGERQDRPWSEWKAGKPITPRQLAKLLAPFTIAPSNIRLPDGTTPKGYHRSTFDDVFGRYLPLVAATPPQPAETLGKTANLFRHMNGGVADEKSQITAETLACGVVADKNPLPGGEEVFSPNPEGAPAPESTGAPGWRARL